MMRAEYEEWPPEGGDHANAKVRSALGVARQMSHHFDVASGVQRFGCALDGAEASPVARAGLTGAQTSPQTIAGRWPIWLVAVAAPVAMIAVGGAYGHRVTTSPDVRGAASGSLADEAPANEALAEAPRGLSREADHVLVGDAPLDPIGVEALPAVTASASTSRAPSPKRSPKAPSDSPDEIRAELQHASAMRALMEADPARCLAEWGVGERRFPQGALREEREAIAIEALAKLGRSGELRARADAFLRRYPQSSSVERVRAWRDAK